MPTFTPPIEDGQAWGQSGHEFDKLMRFYGSVPTGATVYQDQNNVWHQQQYPYDGRPDAPGLKQAKRVYVGGHVHEINDVQLVELAAAGYFDRVNIADVRLHWRTEDLAKLRRSQVSNTPGDVVAAPRVNGAEQGVFTLSSGAAGTSGGQRDWFIHSDILYENFEVETFLNNPLYGEAGRLQQGGIVLRYQEDPANDVKYGITINNNVFFFVPVINVGVWSANMAGTAMLNRQYGFPLDSTFNPLFPFKIGIKLTDNICQVRTWQAHEQPPPWSDDLTTYVRSKAIDLDVDAGSPAEVANIPTPEGRGGAGIIAAHMGTTAQILIGETTFINPDNHPELS